MTNKSKSGQKMVMVDTTMVRPKVEPPEELSKQARKYWRRVVRSVPNEQFTNSDFIILSAYCENYALMVEAREKLDEQGSVLVDSQDKSYKNPWFQVFQDASSKVTSISTKVRLCPSARIKAESTKEKAPNSRATTRLGGLIK